MLCVLNYFVATTMRALARNDLASTSALVASDLSLRNHAWEDLLANNLDTSAIAAWAGVNVVR